MLKLLRRFFQEAREAAPASAARGAAHEIETNVPESLGFPISSHVSHEEGLPFLDWEAAQNWVETLPTPEAQAEAWTSCERAWLKLVQAALGPAYNLVERRDAVLLSTLAGKQADAVLDFIDRTRARIVRLLDGVASVPEWGKDILIVFDDANQYYR